MKFVSTYLTRNHFIRAPHRWFAAFILAPLHAAELHYKRRYHITYIHAKKLFFFDLLLVAGMISLLATTVFWFTFDPTVTQYVLLSIAPEVHDPANTDFRIRSGEHVTYTVTYENNSDTVLEDALIRVQLPSGFIIDEGTRSVPLPDLQPGDSGAIKLSGFFYEAHEYEHHITAILEYSQEGKSFKEQKISTIIQTLRGSIVVPTLSLSDTILAQGAVPLSLTLTNTNHHKIDTIQVPFPEGPYDLSIATVSKGELVEDAWQVKDLAPGESVTLQGSLTTSLSTREATALFEITPYIVANGTKIRQQPAAHTFTILRPEATLSAVWESAGPLTPGGSRTLVMTLQNTGTVTLSTPSIEFVIPNTIEATGLILANGGSINQNLYTLPITTSLAPGESIIQEIAIPIRSRLSGGNDRTIDIEPRIVSAVSGLASTPYQSASQTVVPLAIGTNAFLNASIRYYTDEGDQLGRGPLPAQVGKETKYWAFISLQNTSSRIINMSFSANLTDSAQWTGKSSVSHGAGLFYNSSQHTVSWNNNVLGAYNTLGLFMELAITPTASQAGTTPILLENITITGEDGYTNLPITRSIRAIDISLPEDDIGQERGFTVIE